MKFSWGRPSLIPRSLKRHSPFPYVVLVFCLVITFALWMFARRGVQREAHSRFETQAQMIADAIDARLQTYVQTLYQTRGFFQTHGIPSQDEFAIFMRSVNVADYYPGIQGLGFSQRISRTEVDAHITFMRAHGSPTFRIHPAGDRPEYYPIVLLDPMDWRNQRAFGFDMHTDPVRQRAMDAARDSAMPAATDVVTLIQETDPEHQPGFLIYLPLYKTGLPVSTVEERRAALQGFVYSAFRAHDFFVGIFSQPDQSLPIDFEVFDGNDVKPETLLYDRDGILHSKGARPHRFSQTMTLTVAGQTWALYLYSLPPFEQRIANRVPSYVLGTGLTLSLLIFCLFLGYSIKVRNEHVLLTEAHRELAERRRTEAELRNSEESYRVLTETTTHGVWTATPAGTMSYINRWWQQYTGLAMSETLREDWEAIVHPQHHTRLQEWLKNSDTKSMEVIEIPFRRAADGTFRWHLARRSPVLDADEKVLQWVTVAIDIHKLKELEEARRAREEELRIVTDALPALIAYTDAQQTLRFLNLEFERWLARPLSEMQGLKIDELWPQFLTNVDQEQHYRKAVLQGRRVSFETILRHSDGSERVANITYVPRFKPDGRTTEGFFTLVTDLSLIKKMEEELKVNQERFELVTRSVNLGLWYCDLPFDRLIWNVWVKEHFWLPHDAEVTIDTFYERMHPEDRDKTRNAIDDSILHKQPYDIEYRTLHPDSGDRKWIRAIGRSFYDANGQPVRFDGVTIDITEQKSKEVLLHEQMHTTETLYKIGKSLAAELDLKRLLQTITDSATEAISAEFGAFFYNVKDQGDAALTPNTLSGASVESLSGFPALQDNAILGPTFAGEGIVRLGDLTRDGRFEKNEPFLNGPEGHQPMRSYLAVPVQSRHGDVLGGLVFSHHKPDMFTDSAETLVAGIALHAAIAIDNAALFQTAESELAKRREAEDNLRTLNEELEARVRDRTAQLQAANQELEAFAYSVSHDLRAPLRGIDGFSSILDKRYASVLDEQGRHYLKRVKDAAGRMSHLIDDMLNLTRLTRQDMQRIPLDLSALARSVAKFLVDSESQRQVEFRIQPNLQVQADPILMRAVLENLLGNAWKFTSHRENGAVIEVGSQEVEGHPTYYVKDNGAGFDMEYAEKLFRPFQRLHSTQEFPGSGIGLASVQRVIHRHGGKVWAQGHVNQGATFYFTLACSERTTV
ncbi:MAG TPA: CHASE domain-containing protein [Oligoflexus sp.]|uniref:CHASE domain-containing protein n=1 Tax=Oligoflexus sp. TaxID=1971216 RepID=UPI002D501E69|nr:CHASE domain-containing protein [Oligoflexus sp.]HYX36823.1 CHASE domain-containing protein [Oligoflexus sp.]